MILQNCMKIAVDAEQYFVQDDIKQTKNLLRHVLANANAENR